jgi:hypothetical protein
VFYKDDMKHDKGVIAYSNDAKYVGDWQTWQDAWAGSFSFANGHTYSNDGEMEALLGKKEWRGYRCRLVYMWSVSPTLLLQTLEYVLASLICISRNNKSFSVKSLLLD